MRAALGSLLIATVLATPAAAHPRTPNDRAQAKLLYQAGEAEAAAGQFAQAARDYGAAYEITRDPVLFFKIGSANEKAGQCGVAVAYYRRYLKEAAPSPKFVELTTARITACGQTVEPPPPAPPPPPVEPPPPAPVVVPPPPAPAIVAPMQIIALPPSELEPAPHHHVAAWVVGGSAVAFAVVGIVFADAAHSTESDVTNLYTAHGAPPTYDAATQKQYQDLQDRGHRDEALAWTAFGLTAVAAGVSTYLFTRPVGAGEVVVAPSASAHGAGVSVGWPF